MFHIGPEGFKNCYIHGSITLVRQNMNKVPSTALQKTLFKY